MKPPEREAAPEGMDDRRDADVGAEIRRRREAQRLSQQALAQAVGTTQQTIDRIERGSVTFSRYLSPILTTLALEEARERESKAHSFVLASGGGRLSIPLYEWRNGTMESARESLFSPDRLRESGEGYAVRIWGVVKSPSGDPIFQPGDVLFASRTEPLRHNGWCLIFGHDEPEKVRFGLYADPAAMPPQITAAQLAEWGFVVVDQEAEGAHPIVAYYAASHAGVLT